MQVFDSNIEEAVKQLIPQLELEALAEFREPEKFMFKKAMETCGMLHLPVPVGDGIRCSGECICDGCGQEFFKHPFEWRKVGFGNVPFLNILCDGTLVKL